MHVVHNIRISKSKRSSVIVSFFFACFTKTIADGYRGIVPVFHYPIFQTQMQLACVNKLVIHLKVWLWDKDTSEKLKPVNDS